MRQMYFRNFSKKFIILLFVLILTGIRNFAQVSPELLNQLTQPITDCKAVSMNSQTLISGYNLDQTKSILSVLDAWQQLCGQTEPIMRMRMLIDIKNGTFEETKYKVYFDYYISKFEQRIRHADNPDYQNPNSSYANYLDYVPVNGTFDNMTRDLAHSLVDAQVTNSMSHLLCILFIGDITTFWTKYNDLMLRSASKEPYPNNRQNVYAPYYNPFSEIYSISTGICLPTGKLKNSFNPSPYIGLDFGGPIGTKYRLVLDFGIVPISENSRITVHKTKDTTVTINALLAIGLKLTRKNQFYKNFFIDLSIGAGVNSISTDLLKKQATGRNKEDTYYSLTTADFNCGVSVRYRFKNKMSVSVFNDWHLAPYSWSKISTPSIGNQYMISGLRFSM